MIQKRSVWIFGIFIFILFCCGPGFALSGDSVDKESKHQKPKAGKKAAKTGSSSKKFDIKFHLPIISLSSGPHLRLGEDDLDRYRLGEKDYLAALSSYYYTTDFNWDDKNWNWDSEARAVFYPFRFGFGRAQLWTGFSVGMGWNKFRTEGDYSVDYVYQNLYDETHQWNYSHDYLLKNNRVFLDTNILLRKPFFCRCPGKPKFYGYFGLEYNCGRLNRDVEAKYDANFINGAHYYYSETKTRSEEVKDTAWGIRYGLGTDFKISNFLHLSLELYGRSVKFDDWTGERTDNWVWDDNGITGSFSDDREGKLWFFKGFDPVYGSYPLLEVWEDEPDLYYTDVRPAELKLNSLGIRLSLNFRLQGLKLKF